MPARPFLLLAALLLLVPTARAQSQTPASFEVQREALATPQRLLAPAEFLGYALGDRFTPHHLVVDYVQHVAAASPRVAFEVYGATNQGRPLLLVTIATPERMGRIESVRADHLRRAGYAEGAPSGTDAPAIAWLSYNVHGNESVSTEAAMQVLYDLADERNARTSAWLANTVVLLDPCLNPDGRERYVQWYTQTVGASPNPEPEAREHREPWPGGRTNHYLFDLNRDWAWGTQTETRARLTAYHRWMPHLHADYHEQGVNSPYYFAPAAEPFHDAITGFQRTFQNRVGATNARDFDADGRLYFTRERFDLLYPGYGDTWPTFAGAVGMTYEQGGSGRAGLAIRTAEGDTLTLAERILNHHTTSLGTLATVSTGADELVAEMQRYVADAREAAGTPYRAIALRGDADRLRALGEHLRMQGIAFGYATRNATRRGLRYRTGETQSVTVVPGDLVVSLRQPRGTLARVLFEPEVALTDSLTYDMTAWALPHLYDLDAYALTEPLEPDAATPPRALGPALAPDTRPYAYLVGYRAFADAQFLADLLARGVRVRMALAPFRTGERDYDRGTLIVTRRGNERLAGFDAIVREAAARHGQPLAVTATGFVESGADFGSSGVMHLAPPRVAMVLGEDVSGYGGGEVWHHFEQDLGYPLTVLPSDGFGGVDLDDYDVLILPSGRYGAILPERRLDAVRDWVRGGGKLIALGSAAHFLARADGFGLDLREPDEDDEDDAPDLDRRYADRERASISGDVPGAFFRARVDPTHPLAFGFDDTLPVLRTSAQALEPLEDGWNVVRLNTEDPLLAGFAGVEALADQPGALAVGVEDLGRGQVIYFADDPVFRGFWYAGKLLFANAVLLSGQD